MTNNIIFNNKNTLIQNLMLITQNLMLITLVYLCIDDNMFHVFFYYLVDKCVYMYIFKNVFTNIFII
jgi:hypothetical protein